MEAWFFRGYLVFAAAVMLLAGVVAVRVDLLPEDGRATAGDAAQATSVALPATPTVGAAVAIATATVPGVADRDACEVSPQLMIPPPGVAWDPMFPVWYGEVTQPLAVAPFALSGSDPTFPDTGTYWFAGEPQPVLWHGTGEALTVSAAPVGGAETARLEFEPIGDRAQLMQMVQLTFPEAGCWELTATDGHVETTMVVAVAPLEERPDYVLAFTGNTAQPFAVPAGCDVTVWSGPGPRQEVTAPFWWVETPGLAIGHRTAVMWAGAEGGAGRGVSTDELLILEPDDDVTLVGVNARALDGSERVQADARLRPGGSGGSTARLIFPTAGCWEVTPVSASGSLEPITVYVFPDACRRESGAEPVPTECVAP